MSEDQEARIRDCVFDEDITYILDRVARWFEDSAAEALAECLSDVRNILLEPANGKQQ